MKKKGYILYLVGVFLILGFSSCEVNVVDDNYGLRGRDGESFLALQWYKDEPRLIDVCNSDIPSDFYWNRFYKVYPGSYKFYYEGKYFDGRRWADYAWELKYDIWIEAGEQGGYRYDGQNGRNTYFTIECNPRGPYYSHELKSSGNLGKAYKQKLNKGDSVVVEQSDGNYKARFIYKKVK